MALCPARPVPTQLNTHIMYYYEVYAVKGSIEHREYATFARKQDAQILKEELTNQYDVVGVNELTKKQYNTRVSQD